MKKSLLLIPCVFVVVILSGCSFDTVQKSVMSEEAYSNMKIDMETWDSLQEAKKTELPKVREKINECLSNTEPRYLNVLEDVRMGKTVSLVHYRVLEDSYVKDCIDFETKFDYVVYWDNSYKPRLNNVKIDAIPKFELGKVVE